MFTKQQEERDWAKTAYIEPVLTRKSTTTHFKPTAFQKTASLKLHVSIVVVVSWSKGVCYIKE